MKSMTKTMIPALLATAVVSGAAVAADYDKPAPSWMDYRSTVSNMPIDRSYNDINVEKTRTDIDIEKTKTDNSTADSYNTNKELNADVDVDASQRTKTDNSTNDSYNKELNADVDLDASRRMDDSYNTDNSKKAKNSFNRAFELDVDASRHANDSYNTDNSDNSDNSEHVADSYNDTMKDSYNTDNSVNDSYNTHKDLRFKLMHDKMVVSPELNSKKKQYVGDAQSGSNTGQIVGPNQSGYVGGADIGGIGNDAPTHGTGWGSEYGYGGGDNRKSSNKQKIRVDGPNFGAVANTSVVNQGRDQVFGPNRSALGNDFGGRQFNTAGDQVQAQSNEAYKSGDNVANATDNITNSATKSSTIE